MNYKIILILLAMFLFVNCTIALSMDDSHIKYLMDKGIYSKYKFDKHYIPTDYELSVINYILRNTYENNIHKMRGENENVVYIQKNKENNGYSEAVYNKNGDLVTNSYNQGSFNYFFYETEPIKHFGYDMLPWLVYGNTSDDPTTFEERLYYYIWDLNIGIQTYIFEGDRDSVDKINFKDLPTGEKRIYQFFAYIIFNKEYNINLNENNKEKLKKESKYYFKYFEQIQQLLIK
ncbi:hypothetical protein BX659_13138 [Orenia metallireducens]|uniref:Uncharacterized protein n=1 Tax=Orenia metallireducens TaxID=1413210 RepID=A0A285I923_9FIRM|nr:hypothetical protein [Orenia metallireducens]PRX21696.1 hypothetical protein BX659_13138 [Orenia metallireducens]SNY44465.1 hypothetical protein SAMN06265827_13438 [Orenia metallireducens]